MTAAPNPKSTAIAGQRRTCTKPLTQLPSVTSAAAAGRITIPATATTMTPMRAQREQQRQSGASEEPALFTGVVRCIERLDEGAQSG